MIYRHFSLVCVPPCGYTWDIGKPMTYKYCPISNSIRKGRNPMKRSRLLTPLYSDHMVLQRRKPLFFRGQSLPHDIITLTLCDHTEKAKADDNGHWSLAFPPQEASEDNVLTVRDSKEELTLTDIAIGEVWLAGGQSNMEFSLAQCSEWKEYADPADRNPKVRFFYTPKVPYRNELYARKWEETGWQDIHSPGFGDWSAIGYQFGDELARTLGVTVGIIGCNWGGTSASAWMSRKAILSHDSTRIYIDEYEAGIAGQALSEQYAAYDRYEAEYNEWNRQCGELYAAHPDIEWDEVNRLLGPCQYPGPMNAGNPFRPCGLYDQMLCEIAPYTLAGFLYYQGESDDHRPKAYYDLFSGLIQNWRALWHDNTLPMMITQLTMHRYKADPDFKNWPIIREAQLRVFREDPHTGLAVIPDCGEFNEIHPKAKKPVAHRLALQALYRVYDLLGPDKAMAPIYDHMTTDGAVMTVHFQFATGLCLNGPADGFELAGSDRRYYPATARIAGPDTLLLESPEVSAPRYARYLWTNYGLPCLYGANGLPASPFRTSPVDGSEDTDGHAAIQQIMET